jgi:hypothetical protein
MDNGPKMMALALCDYCRLASTRTTYIARHASALRDGVLPVK